MDLLIFYSEICWCLYFKSYPDTECSCVHFCFSELTTVHAQDSEYIGQNIQDFCHSKDVQLISKHLQEGRQGFLLSPNIYRKIDNWTEMKLDEITLAPIFSSSSWTMLQLLTYRFENLTVAGIDSRIDAGIDWSNRSATAERLDQFFTWAVFRISDGWHLFEEANCVLGVFQL